MCGKKNSDGKKTKKNRDYLGPIALIQVDIHRIHHTQGQSQPLLTTPWKLLSVQEGLKVLLDLSLI